MTSLQNLKESARAAFEKLLSLPEDEGGWLTPFEPHSYSESMAVFLDHLTDTAYRAGIDTVCDFISRECGPMNSVLVDKDDVPLKISTNLLARARTLRAGEEEGTGV